jgi:hypothetical protein
VVGTTSVSLSSGYSQPNLYVTTANNYQFAGMHPPGRQAPQNRWWSATGGVTLACVLLGSLPSKRRKCQWLLSLVALCVLSAGLGGCAGAGSQSAQSEQGVNAINGSNGSGNNSTVNVGSYPIVVIATTTTTTNIMHSVTVNLVVQ